MSDEIIQPDITSDIGTAVREHMNRYSQRTEATQTKIRRAMHCIWMCLYTLIGIGCTFSFLRSLIAHYGWGDFIPICIVVILVAVTVGSVCNMICRGLEKSAERRNEKTVAILNAFLSADWFRARELLGATHPEDQFISLFVGIAHLYGLGGFDKRVENCVNTLKRLCSEGFWPAFYVLGRMHELGIGVAADPTIAQSLFVEGAHARENTQV